MEEITEETAQKTVAASGRGKFLLIVSMAFVPILIAYLMYFYLPEVVPQGRTNVGELISPPTRVEAVADALSDGRWVIMQLVDGPCDDICEQTLHMSHQLHTALGKDASRVRRAVVTVPGTEDPGNFGDENIAVISDAAVFRTLSLQVSGEPGNHILLMDPLGNIMMQYSPDQVGKPLLKDLKHLLRISNIG